MLLFQRTWLQLPALTRQLSTVLGDIAIFWLSQNCMHTVHTGKTYKIVKPKSKHGLFTHSTLGGHIIFLQKQHYILAVGTSMGAFQYRQQSSGNHVLPQVRLDHLMPSGMGPSCAPALSQPSPSHSCVACDNQVRNADS